MKIKMHYKTFISIVLLMLLQTFICKSQEAFDRIFNSAKAKIAEIENTGYIVSHLDVERLSSDEPEETRLSLYKGCKYVIAACGDQDRIKTIQIELFEEIKNSRKPVQKGRDGITPPGSSVIGKFIPEENGTYIVMITASEFASGNINTGRYYLITASIPDLIELTSITKEDAKFNFKTKKLKYKNLTDYSCTFRICIAENFIEQEIQGSSSIKYDIEADYADDINKDIVKYQIRDPDGKKYSFEFNQPDKSILMLELYGHNNMFTGTRYILK